MYDLEWVETYAYELFTCSYSRVKNTIGILEKDSGDLIFDVEYFSIDPDLLYSDYKYHTPLKKTRWRVVRWEMDSLDKPKTQDIWKQISNAKLSKFILDSECGIL